jgi:hypothetical protein
MYHMAQWPVNNNVFYIPGTKAGGYQIW